MGRAPFNQRYQSLPSTLHRFGGRQMMKCKRKVKEEGMERVKDKDQLVEDREHEDSCT